MIEPLTALEPCRDFIDTLNRDPAFSDPMLSTPEQLRVNLQDALGKPNDHVLGVFQNGRLTGLFVFLILPEERYIEMIVGLSRSAGAYEEIADFLAAHYPGFQADFVFNPANAPLRALLVRKGAEFDPEQQKMVLGELPSIDTSGVEPLSAQYRAQYLALHGTDCYWTGEKVLEQPDRFRVFLAVEDDTVVGYLDVTHCYEENEVYALEVAAPARGRGWGRKLLVRALEANRPHGMMLLVDADNAAAIALYRSAGFEVVPDYNSLTATWHIPG